MTEKTENAPRKPMVFVPQVPSTYEKLTNMWIPKISLLSAARFGTLTVLLPPGANRAAVGQIAIAMREGLKDALPGDYLLPTGDPALIALASIYLARRTGQEFRLLKWDNRANDYIPMEITL